MSKEANQLIFKIKYIDEIIICDYCQYRKCHWLKYNNHKLPEDCPETIPFNISDELIPKNKFKERLKIAKKIGAYHPGEKKWYFSVFKAKGLSPYEIEEIIITINDWSEKNKFKLSSYVHYEKRKYQRNFH